MIKGCIFDFDGTLANTLSSIAYFANNALSACGYPTIPEKRYYSLVGNGAKNLIERMLKEVGANPSDEKAYTKLRTTYDANYAADFMHLVTVYDGIIPLLEELNRRKILTAVLSNKPDDMTKCIARELFGSLLCHIQGQTDEIPRKPAPDGALSIVSSWGLSPDECLYIGDTDVDMKTGKAAGMITVGVLWGFRDRAELEANQADRIIASPEELLPLLSL